MMKTGNPYIGPRSFTRKQRDRFFGRSREVRNLLSLVISERLVLFYAQSGAGKTSLLNTSLIPALEENERAVLPVGRVSGELPAGVEGVDNIFVFNLVTHLDQSNTDPARFARMELKDFLEHLSSADGESYAYDPAPVKEEEEIDEDEEVLLYVLIIDQFEEILIEHPERWRERAEFFRQLDQAMQHDPGLFVVLTLREDYVAALESYSPLLTDRMRSRFYMERMERGAALAAVTMPAEQYGRPFAPGAAEALVDNLSLIRSARSAEPRPGQYIEPVQLQVVCYQLWRNLPPGKEITLEQVRRIGDLDDALADFYEQAVAETLVKTGGSELELRRWFDRKLITEAGTRGTVFQGEEATGGMDNRAVRLLEDRFLLRAESRAGAVWYELVHDRFVEPIQQANQEWLERQGALLRDALSWKESGGKDTGLLYTGEKLENTLAGIDGENLQETVVKKFLAVCKAEQAAIEEKETARQAEERRRRNTILRLSVGLLFAVLLSVFSFVQWRNAKKQTLEANYNLAKAFEEKALSALERGEEKNDVSAFKEAVLFTSAALKQKIEEDKQALDSNSVTRLFAPEIFKTAFAEQWSSSAAGIHQSPVYSVSFSPDGNTFASASRDKTVRLRDIGSGKELIVFKGHEEGVYSVSFSPDGKTLASASKDKTVRLWDIGSGKQLNVFTGHQEGVISVFFSPDGNTLASSSWDKTVRLWDIGSGKQLNVFKGHQDGVISISFSPDGKTLASASKDKTVRLWDIAAARELYVFEGHEEAVYGVVFSPDGKTLASGSVDKTVRIWDITSGKELNVLKGHEEPVLSVAFSPDGETLASSSADKTVRLWDISGKELIAFKGHEDGVYSVSFSPDGKTLASASKDKTVRLWDITAARELNVFKEHQEPFYGVSFSPDGKTIASACYDKTVRLWDISSGKQLNVFKGHEEPVSCVSFSPDGKTLASSSWDKTVRLWDITSGKQLNVFKGHQEPVSNVSFSPDGKTLASSSWDKTVRLWDIGSGKQLNVFKGHDEWVFSVSFSPDGKTLASASVDKTMRLWDIAAAKELNVFRGHEEPVSCVSFSPDGKTLASASWDKTVRLWDIGSGKQLNVFTGHQEGVISVSFSPDRKTLASASWDKTVRLWDIGSGKELIVFKGHEEGVYSVSFSPDGKTLASASKDKTVRLWDKDMSHYNLFLHNGKSTPLYRSLMEGVQFLWQVELNGLEFVPTDYKRTRTQYSRDGYNFICDEKFRPLLNPPPPGKNKFEQVLEWAKAQQAAQ